MFLTLRPSLFGTFMPAAALTPPRVLLHDKLYVASGMAKRAETGPFTSPPGGNGGTGGSAIFFRDTLPAFPVRLRDCRGIPG